MGGIREKKIEESEMIKCVCVCLMGRKVERGGVGWRWWRGGGICRCLAAKIFIVL